MSGFTDLMEDFPIVRDLERIEAETWYNREVKEVSTGQIRQSGTSIPVRFYYFDDVWISIAKTPGCAKK